VNPILQLVVQVLRVGWLNPFLHLVVQVLCEWDELLTGGAHVTVSQLLLYLVHVQALARSLAESPQSARCAPAHHSDSEAAPIKGQTGRPGTARH